MKQLEIDTTDTQLIIKIAGSKVAHVCMRDDATQIRATLLEVLSEAPERKEELPEPEEDVPDEVAEGDFQGAVGELLQGLGDLLRSAPAQKTRAVLEKLPKARRRQG